jgi:peptidoglycan hydrolase-like protein with peptidoglycan-binding domain
VLLLERGDRLPTVAACQALLNAHRPDDDPIAVDGIFGQQTQKAVVHFQSENRLPLTQKIDADTWEVLSDHHRLVVHDHVDLFDPMLRQSARVLENAGARPTFAGGTCNGVAALGDELRATGAGRVILLRLHGHGNRGVQALSYGSVVHTYYDAILGQPVPDLHHVPDPSTLSPDQLQWARSEAQRSQLSRDSLQLPDVSYEVGLLSPLFHPLGCIEFHGCQVGGRQVGRSFLRDFAARVGVPAVAARARQLTDHAVRFSGPVEMQFPSGASLTQWARSKPPIRSSS